MGYNFYLPTTNKIIEVNGIRHYSDSFESYGGRSLDDEQKNDKYKEHLAKRNDIDNYIVIDVRKSNLEYIKDSILSSRLNILLKINTIDFNKIQK